MPRATTRSAPHGDDAATHAANVSPGTVTFFDGSSDHANGEGSGGVDVAADCSLCHGSTNLLNLHANDCSICHSGSTPPRNTFASWNKTCSQGSCHPSYHNNASPGHDGVYADRTNCSCHDNGIPESSDPISASESYCGPCHATGVDTTAPTTVSNALASYVGPAAVTLTATDDRTVKATYYRLDGGATQTLSGGAVLIAAPVSGAQAHTLEFWSVDWAGNTETPHTTAFLTVSTDTQAPVTTSDAKPAYAGPVTIKLTATDNATNQGVQTTYYRFDGGATQTGTTASLPQPASGTVTRTIYFWSVDYSGNVEAEKSATFTVTNDSVAPTTTTNLLPAPKYYPAARSSSTCIRPTRARHRASPASMWTRRIRRPGGATGTRPATTRPWAVWQLAMWANASGNYPVT